MARTLTLAAILLGCVGTLRADGPAPTIVKRPIDVVICLDVSNSMDGLIASAKQKLWDIVNDLARAKPVPDLRVALYSYGHTSYDANQGWVRKEIDLTVDLDEIYRKLFALSTGGGEEYVARVCQSAIDQQPWSTSPLALKIIFVCGNEPATQDKQVSLETLTHKSQKQGILINPIYCGNPDDQDAGSWRQLSALAGGRFAHIDQNRGAVSIATPFDKPLADLSSALNQTYVAYGQEGKLRAENQLAQDKNALAAGSAAAAGRAAVKAGGLYRNSAWDLIDRLKDDPKLDLSTLKDEELNEEMRKLKPEERKAFVQKKAAEREQLQKQIADIHRQRETYIKEQMKNNPSSADKAFDAAVREMLRQQAATRGLQIP